VKILLKASLFSKAVVLTTLLVMGSVVQSASVIPGATVALSGTTWEQNPDLGGGDLTFTAVPFEIKDGAGMVVMSGFYDDSVSVSSNTGKAIFNPRIRGLSSPNGASWITALQITGFAGVTTDIDYRPDGLGDVGPNEVTRSASTGDEILFKYDPNTIAPPQTGHFLSIMTDVTSYCLNGSVTISAQKGVGGPVFSTTLSDTVSPDTSGAGSTCSTIDPGDSLPNAPTIDSNLEIQVPSATYDSGQGTTNLWFKLEYAGVNGDGKHTWALKEYGTN